LIVRSRNRQGVAAATSAAFEPLLRSRAAMCCAIRFASRGTPLIVSEVIEYRKWRPTNFELPGFVSGAHPWILMRFHEPNNQGPPESGVDKKGLQGTEEPLRSFRNVREA
jgi:hypothetical protein